MKSDLFHISLPLELKIVLISVLAGLIGFGIVFYLSLVKNLGYPFLTGDTGYYRILAQNLLNYGVFSAVKEGPLVPESFRTPGYPAFLALTYAVVGNWTGVMFIQTLISALAPLFLYLIGKELFGEKIAFWAVIIFIIDPTRIFLSVIALSDALFVVVFLASLRLFISQRYFYSGILLGVSTLIRPIAQFLPILLIVFSFLYFKKEAEGESIFKLFFKKSGVFVFGFILIVSPWAIRNYIHFGSMQISSVGSYNLLFYNASLYLHHKTGETEEVIYSRFKRELDSKDPYALRSLENSAKERKMALDIIFADPIGYAKFHLIKIIPFFATDGLRDIARTLKIMTGSLPDISGSILKGELDVLRQLISNTGLPFFLLLVGSSFWLLVCLLAVVGFALGLRSADLDKQQLVLLAAIILYFALLSSPVANARYRLPVDGILLLFAALGMARALKLFLPALQRSFAAST